MDASQLGPKTAAWAEELGIPGAAVGVLGQEPVTVELGVLNNGSGEPVREDTGFPIASTTKPLTATAVLHHVEQGTWSLDTRAIDVVPELSAGGNHAFAQVTLRHLLTHSGGFQGDLQPQQSRSAVLQDSVDQLAGLPQMFDPGTFSSYSNAGFQLLGVMLERVTGRPFGEVLATTVLEPLGMTQTCLFGHTGQRPVVQGHGMVDGELRAVELTAWPSEDAQGGLVSTMRDLLRWARFQLHGAARGQPPVSEATRLLMQQPAIEAMPPLRAYGMPWQIRTGSNGLSIVGHGGTHGNVCVTTFDLVPSLGLAVATVANRAGGKELGRRVLAWCLEELGVADRSAPSPSVPAPPELDLAEFVGCYRFGLGDVEVTREAEGLRVVLHFDDWVSAEVGDQFPALHVNPCAVDTFALAGQPARPVCTFYRDSDGAPTHLGFMGRIAARVGQIGQPAAPRGTGQVTVGRPGGRPGSPGSAHRPRSG